MKNVFKFFDSKSYNSEEKLYLKNGRPIIFLGYETKVSSAAVKYFLANFVPSKNDLWRKIDIL